jgi:hypothetical protein
MNVLVDPPEAIPISITKLEEFLNKEYKINLKIDGNFIFSVLDDKYDYHIYKRGEKKGTLKIFKTRNKNKKDKKELSKYNFEEKKEEFLYEKHNKDICLNNESKYKLEKENLKKTLDSIKSSYEYLYFDFYDLVYKYKSVCELSKTIIFNFKKINKIIINNNDIKKENYMDILIIINKIILQEKAINNFLLYL